MFVKDKLLEMFQKSLNIFNYLFTSNLNENKYLKKKFVTHQNLTVFDIGANLGSFSKNILKMFPSSNVDLHLFEPNKSLVITLKKTFNQSKVNGFAISDKNEQTKLYISNISSQSSLIKNNSFVGKDVGEQNIESIRLDNYILKEGIEKINLLKIDIEGYELNALKSLGNYLENNIIDIIKIEISFKNKNNFGLINSLLNKNNYFIDGFTNVKYLEGEIFFVDAYFSKRL